MKTVLFVCVHNAGRSQMAEAFLNEMARVVKANVRAESAGTQPASHVHPEVVKAMHEVGIDVATRRPKVLTDKMVERADLVVTMGCGVTDKACPAILYRNVEDWALPDPKGQPLELVRSIRDQVRARVLHLLDQLANGDASRGRSDAR